jgi:transcriptional regulator with XRE-family HTH domain
VRTPSPTGSYTSAGLTAPSGSAAGAALRAECLAEMRKKAGLTQTEVAEAMGVSQQRVSAIESGVVAELATLGDYVRALGGELKVIADFGD